MFFGGDPFEHFAQAGGGGGRRPGGSRAPANVDTTKLYETLGIEKTADDKAIKKAFRKLAVKHHPDKGGDEQKFKEISAAYKVLSDPEKRVKYDKYGLEGISDDGPGRGGAEDIFSMFFGGGGRGGGGGGGYAPRKGDDVNHPLKVSLEDLYNGKTVKLAINRQIQVGEAKMCTDCDGRGVVVELRQIALGMVQQVQKACPTCKGEGYIGETKKERKVLEVHIEKGMKNGQKVVFRGMADEKPNMEPGDINFIVQEKEHSIFKRKGADLLITKTLSLNEAICGFEWSVTHLDKREILIQSKPGEVIKPESLGGQPFVKIVSGEGMPSKGNPFVKGDLYVLFTIEFPKECELSNEQVSILKQTLPNPKLDIEYDEETTEVVHLDTGDVKNFGKGGAAELERNYDSDDADGQQNVECRQS